MYKIFLLTALVSILVLQVNDSSAQEVQLATFQEMAQVIIDQKISNNVTASITLQSTSSQEFRIPAELEQKIIESDRIIAVIMTNEERCILGAFDETCIMINISREGIEGGIKAIQDTAREIGDAVIDDVNEALKTDAEFHSTFIHVQDEMNVDLDTSGDVSGRGTVSVVYTMHQQDTEFIYEKLTAILLPKQIRNSGGFYDVGLKLSSEPNSAVTFSILKLNSGLLYQLRLAVDYPDEAKSITNVSPLDYLGAQEIQRSKYFSAGFYPLNSLIQVAILPEDESRVSKINGNVLPTQIVNNEKIPSDLTKNGWIFEPDSGDLIDGKYLFGKKNSINKNEFVFSISPTSQTQKNGNIPPATETTKIVIDESQIIIIVVIVIAGVGAAAFYLKGYRTKN